MSIFQFLQTNFLTFTVPLFIAVALFIIFYVSVDLALRKSKLEVEFRQIVMALFRGPVPTAILGYALVVVTRYNPNILEPYLSSEMVSLLIELILLVTSINASRKISAIAFKKFFTSGKVSRRFLLIGVYSLGLLILFYIILTSPLNAAIEQGALPVVSLVSGLVITYIVAYIINLVIYRYQNAIQSKQPQLHTTLTFARRVVMAIIILIGVGATGFTSFPGASNAIASLFVAAGFTSIVIGLAAQSSLSNLIAGGVISTSQPFRIGDAVLYDSEYCYVEDIRLMFTILRTWDNRRLMVPNSQFLNTVIKNYTAVDSKKYSIIYMNITLESDLDLAMQIMKDSIQQHPNFLPTEGLPSVQIMDFSDYGVQLRALGMAKDQSSNWNLEKECLYTIKKAFDKSGIKISVPRREVVLNDPGKALDFGNAKGKN